MQNAEALQNKCGHWLQQHSHTPQTPEKGASNELMMTVIATPPEVYRSCIQEEMETSEWGRE